MVFLLARVLDQPVNFLLGKTIHFAYLPDNASIFEGRHGAQDRGMSFPMAFKQVIKNVVPVVPTIVDVKIRRHFSLGIQKTFKIKIQLQWTYIRYLQAIGNNAIGPAAPADVVKAPVHTVPDNIPRD